MLPKPMFTWMIPLHSNMAGFSYWHLQQKKKKSEGQKERERGTREQLYHEGTFQRNKSKQ
jgi:hypothetical protein